MAEVIGSILAVEPEATLRLAARAAMAGADWIELRLDRWPLDRPLDEVLAAIGLPVLCSCRTPRDGGAFAGSLADRIELLDAALAAGAAGVDLEDWEPWAPAEGSCRLLVRSHHDFRRVPDDLHAIRDGLLEQGGDVAKVVGMAHDLAEAAPLCDLMASSEPADQPTVAFAMGRTAGVTRVLSCALGAPYVYASVEAGAETAPGQVSIADVVGVYGAKAVGLETGLFGLLGNPALHSVGPWVHNRALRRAGLDAVYLPFETSRPKAVADMLPRRRLRGLSVTAPHKEAMAKLCHRLSPDAEAVGAVNTLTFEAHGIMVGHNTDLAGVEGALRRAGLDRVEPGEHGVVFGSGGAARAAAVALGRMGLTVTIMARSLDQVRAFAKRAGFRLASLRQELLLAEPPRVVVHATPVGGAAARAGAAGGAPAAGAGQRLLPGWTPPAGSFVLDMVYEPRKTPLLIDAAAAGAVAVPGIEMFLTQAAEQIRCFTGSRPDEGALRSYLAGGDP